MTSDFGALNKLTEAVKSTMDKFVASSLREIIDDHEIEILVQLTFCPDLDIIVWICTPVKRLQSFDDLECR